MGEALYRITEHNRTASDRISYLVYIRRIKERPLQFYFGQADRCFMEMHEVAWIKGYRLVQGYRLAHWGESYCRGMLDTTLMSDFYNIGACIVEPVTVEQLLVCENEEVRVHMKQRVEFGIREALLRCQARIFERRYGQGF